MANKTILILVFLCISALQAVFAQAPSTIGSLETELRLLDSTITAIGQEKLNIESQIQQNDEKIQALKEKNSSGYFYQQNLESLLKASQSLSRESEKLQYRLALHLQEQSELISNLNDLYEVEINRYVSILQSDTTSASTLKKGIIILEDLRNRRVEISARNQQAGKLVNLNTIRIDDDDTPAQIRQKADLLLDQSDKLLVHAGELEIQKLELKKELDLRTRISDMVSDLALFDQQEEILGNSPASNTRQSLDFDGEVAMTPEDALKTEAAFDNFFVNPNDFDYTTLSPDDLESVIEAISEHQKRLASQADSLKTQADKFNKSAQEQK